MSARPPKLGLLAEFHPAVPRFGGTPNIVKNLASHPDLALAGIISTDGPGPNPLAGPWDRSPVLSLFRPRSLVRDLKVGLGFLDLPAFRLQGWRVRAFIREQGIERLLVLIANDARFAVFAAHLDLDIPVDVYIVDDFVADAHLTRIPTALASQAWDRLIEHSDRVFAISQVFVDDVRRKFGGRAEFLPVPIPAERLGATHAKAARKASEKIIIHHAGNIHHLYQDALALTVASLANAARQLHRPIELELFGNLDADQVSRQLGWALDDATSPFAIRLCGSVTPSQLMIEQERADYLLLCNSFKPEYRPQVRCSFSSKACEYLASATPSIVVGPDHASVVDYFATNQAAHVLTDDNEPALTRGLVEILSADPDPRLIENANRLARENHRIERAFEQLLAVDPRAARRP